MTRKLVLFLLGFTLFLPATLLAAAIDFDPTWHDIGAITTAFPVATGDLNSDGRLDLAVPNYTSNYVSILLGNGDGTFQAAISCFVGYSTHSVDIGDLNSDDRLDLVVVNYSNNYVSILLGNGDGTFQAAVNYVSSMSPDTSSVAIGDLNGDGKPDLVTANRGSDAVSVLLGNGDGTFQDAVEYKLLYDLDPPGTYSVAIGDFNGDGMPDLVTANIISNDVSILLGNGDGTFQQTSVNYRTAYSPYFVTTGDLDGDGKLDLVVAAGIDGGYTISVLRGNGDGTFLDAVIYPGGYGANTVAIGDLNGDGKPDLAVTDSTTEKSVMLLRGNGDGTFQDAVSYSVGDSAFSVAIGDFNGDSLPDLTVTKSGGVAILFNTVDLPAWNATYPHPGLIDTTSAEALVGIDRDGVAYLVCLPSGSDAPSSLQVRAAQDAGGTTLPINLSDSANLLGGGSAALTCTTLLPGTTYDLYTVAADSEGSLQSFPTKLTVTTSFAASNFVPTGTDVVVIPTEGIQFSFNTVSTAGSLTVTPLNSPAPPANFRITTGEFYVFTTTASFSGPVTVCLDYNEAALMDKNKEAKIKLFHRNGRKWKDITSSVDTVNNQVCGQTMSF